MVDVGHRLAQPPAPHADLGEITVHTFDRLAETISQLSGVPQDATWGEVERTVLTQTDITRAVQNALLEQPHRAPNSNALVRQIGKQGPGLAQPRGQAGSSMFSGLDAQKPPAPPRPPKPNKPLLGQGAITDRMADFELMVDNPWAWLDKGIKDTARKIENFKLPRLGEKEKGPGGLSPLFGSNFQDGSQGSDGLFGGLPPVQRARPAPAPPPVPATRAAGGGAPPPGFSGGLFTAQNPGIVQLAGGDVLSQARFGGGENAEVVGGAFGAAPGPAPAGGAMGGLMAPTEIGTGGFLGLGAPEADPSGAGVVRPVPPVLMGGGFVGSPIAPAETETGTGGLGLLTGRPAEAPGLAPALERPAPLGGESPNGVNPVMGPLMGGGFGNSTAVSADRDLTTEFKEQSLKTDTAMFGMLDDPRNSDFGRFLQSDVLNGGGGAGDPTVRRGLFTLLGLLTGVGAIMNALGIDPDALAERMRPIGRFFSFFGDLGGLIGNELSNLVANPDELKATMRQSIPWAIPGAIMGGMMGGVKGALVGAGLGIAFGTFLRPRIMGAVNSSFDGNPPPWVDTVSTLAPYVIGGALLGGKLGGPKGVVVGALAGAMFGAVVDPNISVPRGWAIGAGAAGGIIGGATMGVKLGGPKGAVIGALIGGGVGALGAVLVTAETRETRQVAALQEIKAQVGDVPGLAQAMTAKMLDPNSDGAFYGFTGSLGNPTGVVTRGNRMQYAHTGQVMSSSDGFLSLPFIRRQGASSQAALEEAYATPMGFGATIADTVHSRGATVANWLDDRWGTNASSFWDSVTGGPVTTPGAAFADANFLLTNSGLSLVKGMPRSIALGRNHFRLAEVSLGGNTYTFRDARDGVDALMVLGSHTVPLRVATGTDRGPDGPLYRFIQRDFNRPDGYMMPTRLAEENLGVYRVVAPNTPRVGNRPSQPEIVRVEDAIITKTGQIIHTHPEDNIYAFQGDIHVSPIDESPGALGGGQTFTFGNSQRQQLPVQNNNSNNTVTQYNYSTNLPFSDFMVVGV